MIGGNLEVGVEGGCLCGCAKIVAVSVVLV